MSSSFQSKKEEIVKKIGEKAPQLKCPACGQNNFALTDGYFAHDLQEDFSSRHIGGKNVPVIPIVCKNCGLVMEFAAGVLGFIPKELKEDKNG